MPSQPYVKWWEVEECEYWYYQHIKDQAISFSEYAQGFFSPEIINMVKSVLMHHRLKHKIAIIPKTPIHSGFYKCVTCNKLLALANKHTKVS